MKNVISLDQVLQNIKAQNETSRLTIETAEKTIKIINKIVESRELLGLTQRDLAKNAESNNLLLRELKHVKLYQNLIQ